MMRHHPQRSSAPSQQRGLAMVEFALVAPLLLLVLFSILEFGIVFYDKAVLSNAARQAVRSGVALRATRMTDVEVQAIASNYVTGQLIGFQGSSLQTPQIVRSTDAWGNRLEVSLSYQYKSLVVAGLVNFIAKGTIPNPLSLKASMSMYME